jgi:hypothetical protein
MGTSFEAFEASVHLLLLSNEVDLDALRAISRKKGGFRDNRVRKLVWPALLGITDSDIVSDYRTFADPKHRDAEQVQNDIDRSLWKTDVVTAWNHKRRNHKRRQLQDIILSVLSRNSRLFYFQGFHDIVSVFFLVLEDSVLTMACVEVFSTEFIQDNMHKSFEVVSEIMKLVFVLIEVMDQSLHQYLLDAKSEPFFAVSWFLTWFSHDVHSLEDIARIFDALLCSHPVYIIYLCSSVRLVFILILLSL